MHTLAMARAIRPHDFQCETHRHTQTDIHTHICTNADRVNGKGDRCPWLQSPSVHKPVTVSVRRGVCMCGCVVYMRTCGCVFCIWLYMSVQPHLYTHQSQSAFEEVCVSVYVSVCAFIMYICNLIVYCICMSPNPMGRILVRWKRSWE